MSRRVSRVGITATVTGLLAGLGGASGAATAAGARSAVLPQTLLSTSGGIEAFAQDGGRIAWIGRPRHGWCALHVRTIDPEKTLTTRLNGSDCGGFARASELALADRTAAWAEGYSCGNNECLWTVAGANAGDRRARKIDQEDVGCETDTCSGVPDPKPLLVGAGRLLAYSDGSGRVEQITGGRTHTFFDPGGDVYGLAQGGGLVSAVSLSLARGDSCGCLDAPVWSPDGSKIAYLDGAFFRDSVPDAAVAVMNEDGSGRHELPGASGMSALSWSPDGTKIAYDTLSYGEKIDVANADGSGSVQLTTGTDPAWSPDGTEIAFIRADKTPNTDGGIFVMKHDGTDIRELQSSSPLPAGLAWSPDGSRLAFSIGGGIEIMNADGGNVQLLPNAGGEDPAWSPDGSKIVYSTESGLAVIGADGSGLRQITSGPDEHPSWSPDGKTILFASDRNDPYVNYGFYTDTEYPELYRVDPNGANLRPLSFAQPPQWLNAVTVHSSAGRPVSTLPGLPALWVHLTASTTAALSGDVTAVSGVLADGADQITLFDPHTGTLLATVQVGESDHFHFSVVGGDARWVVFRLGLKISALNVRWHDIIRLANAAARPIGVSVSSRRVAWAENINGRGRIRAVDLPS